MSTRVTGGVYPTPCVISGHPTTCVGEKCATCKSSSFWGAYPYFSRCNGLSRCWQQRSRTYPLPPGTCNTAYFSAPDPCGQSTFWDIIMIHDCGPGFTSKFTTSGPCGTHTGQPGIASLGPGVFKSCTGDSAGFAYMTISVQ